MSFNEDALSLLFPTNPYNARAKILGDGKLSQKGRGLIEGLLEMLHLIEDHCETIEKENRK